MANVKSIESQLNHIIQYLQPLLPLANCHMVNFFTENCWEKFISSEIRNEYSKIGLPGMYKIFGHYAKLNISSNDKDIAELISENPYISQHFSNTRSMSLCTLTDLILSHSQFQEKLKSWGSSRQNEFSVKEFMSPKKTHEVEMMSNVVAALTEISVSSLIVDVGSGKGYLSTMLAFKHNLRVLGVDSSQINTHGAAKRYEKLQKYWPGLRRRAVERNSNHLLPKRGKHWKSKLSGNCSSHVSKDNGVVNKVSLFAENKSISANISLYKRSTVHVTEGSDIVQIVKDSFPDESTYNMSLVGLHTCGNLAATCLRLFIQNVSIKALCNVGCCYHLIEEEFSSNPFNPSPSSENISFGFPMSQYLTEQQYALGRNVRMLAGQAVDRLSEQNKVPVNSLFFRALLQVILIEKYGQSRSDWQVGRIAAKCQDFLDYYNKSVQKLGVDLELSSSQILDFHEQYLRRRNELEAFFLVRVALAPVIETIIMLDRLLYLVEQNIEEVNIIQLFDPVISPRCYGIIALKDFYKIQSKK